MKHTTIFATTVFVLAAASAHAEPIISGNGETWSSTLAAVCGQVGDNAPCSGQTVLINAHPAWKDDTQTNPLAEWVSYADTGYLGSILAPRAGDPSNPAGQTPIIEISESFTGAAGAPLNVRFWADDTLDIYFNNVLVKAAVFGQATCANAPIGCEPDEFWDLIGTTTGGLDTLRMVAYQVGTGTDPNSNPFGVLYSGTYTPAQVPEPAALLLFGTALASLAARVRRGPRLRPQVVTGK
jgi:hypothetical protein